MESSKRTGRWRVAALTLSVGLVLAACGGTDSADESGAAAPAPAPAPALPEPEITSEVCPVPDAGGAQIDVLGWAFPIISAYMEELEACEEAGYKVNVQLLDSATARDQAVLDLSTGSPSFEIIHGDASFVGQLASNGSLLPLNDLVDKYRDEFDLEDIAPGLWDMATIDGQIYGVPIVVNTMHLFYNPELLAAAGITKPPDTYDEVIAACAPLKAAGFDVPFTINLHADWAWRIEFSNFAKALGADIINVDRSPAFNNAQGVAAAEQMVRVVDECMGPSGLAYSIDDTQAGLQTGELPMASIWASRAAAMDNAEASSVVGKIEFGAALRVKGASSVRTGPAYGDFLMIPRNTEVDPEVIFLAIMGATDLQSQSVAAAFGAVSRNSATNDAGPRNGTAATASIDEGVGLNSIDPALAIANAVLGKWLQQIPDGVSIADALANAEAEYLAEAKAQGLL